MSVEFTIDGKKVTGEEGNTVIDVAFANGLDIPHLCYHKDLEPFGGCRICVVEVEKGNRRRLVVSCVYPVEEDIKVETNNERIRNVRKTLIELMLARAPSSPKLLELANEYGAERNRFPVEPNNCILCGLCVRYCDEIKGKNAVGYVGRGTSRRIIFFPENAGEEAQECMKCQECFNLCPTGVMPSNFGIYTLAHFRLK